MKESSFVTNAIRKSSEKTKNVFRANLAGLDSVWNPFTFHPGSKRPRLDSNLIDTLF